jgi:predicted small secreted protein
MKKLHSLIAVILLFGLVLAACAPTAQPAGSQAEITEPPAAATEAPATVAAAEAAAEPTAAQPEAGPAVQHTLIPASPPTSGGEKWGDHSTLSSLNEVRALVGDRFSEGRFERPYNANTMDVYFPHLDIDRAVVYPQDATWVYAVITMVGRDANNAFTGQYAIELDLDRNGLGEYLIMVDHPSSTDWTTQGVRVYKDGNADIGGVDPFIADSIGAASDGYEVLLFDQGTGDDPDLAWVRLDPEDPSSFQIAYKQSLLAGVVKYTAGLWAGTRLDPALFDYDDHLTHERAGAANPEFANYYPIKELAEFDNTCRYAIGYDATGLEPGICPVQ